jgi:hypothetical protein
MSNFYQRWCTNHPAKTFFGTWIVACAVILTPAIIILKKNQTTIEVVMPKTEPSCIDSMNIIRAPGARIADGHHTKVECPKDSVPIVVQYGDPNLIYFSCHCK